jgi:multidrug efflux pump subunit AcrA (membrane-fusion protein)
MKNIIRSISFGLLLALFICACEKQEATIEEPVRPVKVVKVGDLEQFMERKFPGRSKATQEVDLSFRVSGPLITRPVDVGDEVKKGQVLARIDPRDYEIRLNNTEAQLSQAKANLKAMRHARPEKVSQLKSEVVKAKSALTRAMADYNRFKRIQVKDSGAVSQSSVDRAVDAKERAEASLRQAQENLQIGMRGARKEDIEAQQAGIRSLQSAVDSAKDQLAYTYLRAPFDGTIVSLYVENFEDVLAKQKIMRLIDSSKIEFKISVPERLIILTPYVTDVSVVFSAYPEKPITAKIKEVGKEATQATRTYPVTLIMDQPEEIKIMPGMAGTATAQAAPPEMLAEQGIDVPSSAVFSSDNKTFYVWVIDVKTNTAHRREVKIGKLTPFGIRLKEGLKPGETIAAAGVHSISEGQKVRILTEAGKEVPK